MYYKFTLIFSNDEFGSIHCAAMFNIKRPIGRYTLYKNLHNIIILPTVEGLNTNHYNTSISDVYFYCLSDKMQDLSWIRLTAKYQSSSVPATYCLEAHERTLNDTIGNLTRLHLSDCVTYPGVGNIFIKSNIKSTTQSFTVIIYLPS